MRSVQKLKAEQIERCDGCGYPIMPGDDLYIADESYSYCSESCAGERVNDHRVSCSS